MSRHVNPKLMLMKVKPCLYMAYSRPIFATCVLLVPTVIVFIQALRIQKLLNEGDIQHAILESDVRSFQNSTTTAGDCQVIGPRRPKWDDRAEIIQHLPTFAQLYNDRPFRENKGGMRFSHSFGLWYTLRSISPPPSLIVESGVNRGHSTWVIRSALPNSKIISISPNTPPARYNGVTYYTGKNFQDFNQIDWHTVASHREQVVVFFDDHQSAYRRIFEEAYQFGFRRFIFDDNCRYQQCDALSLKWMCEIRRKSEWLGYVRDNFAKIIKKQSWEEHLEQAKQLNRFKVYYEFPPVIGDRSGVKTLLRSQVAFNRLLGPLAKNVTEFQSYAFMGYVEM